jgi:hypothetical protein
MPAVALDPTIADVHTDIGGDRPVSRPPSVLHLGTGLPSDQVRPSGDVGQPSLLMG